MYTRVDTSPAVAQPASAAAEPAETGVFTTTAPLTMANVSEQAQACLRTLAALRENIRTANDEVEAFCKRAMVLTDGIDPKHCQVVVTELRAVRDCGHFVQKFCGGKCQFGNERALIDKDDEDVNNDDDEID